MNPIALRLHEIGLRLEDAGMPEIVAAFGVAEREILRLDDERTKLHDTLKDANDKCRSAYQIAKRVSEEHGEIAVGTNFGAFRDRVHESLVLQQAVLHPHSAGEPHE